MPKAYLTFTKEIDTLRRNGFPLFVIQRSIRQTLRNNIFVDREPVQLTAIDKIYPLATTSKSKTKFPTFYVHLLSINARTAAAMLLT